MVVVLLSCLLSRFPSYDLFCCHMNFTYIKSFSKSVVRLGKNGTAQRNEMCKRGRSKKTELWKDLRCISFTCIILIQRVVDEMRFLEQVIPILEFSVNEQWNTNQSCCPQPRGFAHFIAIITLIPFFALSHGVLRCLKAYSRHVWQEKSGL